MTEIHETTLPGVGVRHDFDTHRGARLGVVTHRTGYRELLVYDREDPDRVEEVVRLDEDDSRTLAELLGATRVADRLASLQQSIEGLAIDWLPLEANAASVGHTIGEYDVRQRTGVSVVAVLRGDQPAAAPGPDFRLKAGDTVVLIGTSEGVKEAFALLTDG